MAKFIEENYENGFGILADVMKGKLYTSNRDVFDRLDFNNDDSFLEPMSVLKTTYNPAPSFGYEQLLIGYMENNKKPEALEVFSDSDGVVYLPNIGYFISNIKNDFLLLRNDQSQAKSTLSYKMQPVVFTFKPVFKIENSPIEIVQYSNPIMDHKFVSDDSLIKVDINSAFENHHIQIGKAFKIIGGIEPWFYSCLLKTVKKCVAFYNPKIRSFAASNTIGINYLSAIPEYDEIFFIEDIIHQSSHNILYFITVNLPEYFTGDAKKEPLSNYCGRSDEHRTVYSAVHGAFSLHNIISVMIRIINANLYSNKQKHELLGRFSDNIRRLKKSVDDIGHRQMYTEKGWVFYNLLRDSASALYSEHVSIADKFDTSNQPYVFDFNKFLELNPIEN